MGRLNYKKLAKAKTKENRNVVISEAYDSKGESVGYVIAEQFVVQEDGKEVNLFLKHSSMGIMDKDGLMNMYKAITHACSKAGLFKENEQNTK